MSTVADTVPKTTPITTEIATALRHTFVYGIGGILLKAVGFLLLPLYTHYLSPRDYGILEILDISMSLLGMFLNMGVTAAMLRYYGIAETEREKRRVVGTIFIFTLCTGTGAFLAGLLPIHKVSLLLLGPGVPTIYLLLAFTNSILAYIANVPYTCLRAKEASGTLATLDGLGSVAILILNIYFIAVLKLSVMGMLLSALSIGSIKIALLVKWTIRDLTAGIDWKLLRSIVKFGAPLVFSNLTMFTLNFSDRFFLERFQSLDIVGIYAVGYKFAYMLNFLLLQPFNMMWQARMYIVHRRPDHEKVFAQVFALYMFVLILGGLGLSLFSSEAVRAMVDPRYRSGEQVIGIVSLSYIFLGAGYYLQLGMFLRARTDLIGIISTVAAIVNLAANYFLIRSFGMLGAAWATVAGFLAIAVGTYYCSQRVCPLKLPVGRVTRGLAMAIGIYLVSRMMPAYSLPSALAMKSALLASFPALLWISGSLSSDERATVHSLKDGAMSLLMKKPA
jgi:O-antigen/teichoic acid export membrane protein